MKNLYHRLSFYLLLSLLLAIFISTAQAATTVRIASGLSRPVFATAPEGDPDRLFIVEQWTARIRIYRFSTGQIDTVPFLHIDSLVINTGNERGLLGLAFHPEYAQNRYFFVYYINNSGHSVIARYQTSATNPDSALASSGEIVLTIPQPPYTNHKGGMLAFGPQDGYLYIGLGDGGDAGDPQNRAQSDTTLIGKILRINVNALPYTIPPDNPFADPADGVRDEIWAKGVRNPWRWSFDRETGAMYVADVGQAEWEEVNYEAPDSPGGLNYGWRRMEGSHCFNPPTGCDPGGLTYPIHEYSHDNGCSITGGYVYRGCAIPEFTGLYFFADYCTDSVWTFRYNGTSLTGLTNRTGELTPQGGFTLGNISSFGQDGYGELYITDLNDGELFKILPDNLGDDNNNFIADECECPETPVTDLVIQRSGSDIRLSWTAAGRAGRCRVYRSPVPAAPFPGPLWILLAEDPVAEPGTQSYTDNGAINDSTASFYLVTFICP